MSHKISRRALVKSGLIAGALVPAIGLFGAKADAAALPPLDPNSNTMAKSLGFVADATKLTAAANPPFKPGEKCGTCAQFQGKSGDATGGCNIFSGYSVPQGGWCTVWAQKPGT